MGSLPHIVEDCMGVLQLYSDGTVHRRDVSFSFSIPDDSSVSFHDAVFDQKLGLSLRLYRPAGASDSGERLPVVLFFHGGGFCVGSRVWVNCHGCCQRLVSALQAVVVAPDYRLAPEHRLPAAIHDAESALKWLSQAAYPDNIANQENTGLEWLGETVDLGRVYVIGDSSGGNMAHQLAVKMGLDSAQFGAVRPRGFMLLAPFFGGVDRTISEEGPSEATLSLEALDRFWRLSIPEGETRDHPFANPFGPHSQNLEKVVLKPILVIVGGKELLKDRVQEYARKLKKMGKDVEYVEFEGEEHGFFTNNPYSEISQQCLQVMKQFMLETSK